MKSKKPTSEFVKGKAVAVAIAALKAAGFVEAGSTNPIHYKVITVNSYPLAGALVDGPGRQRFCRHDGWKCTVGKRTVYFYKPKEGEGSRSYGRGPYYERSAHLKTTDQHAVAEFLKTIDVKI
jgi:hypothetical protein